MPAIHYHAYTNTPGYLPDTDDVNPAFETSRDAWQYLVGEVERDWDTHPDDPNGACLEAHTHLHNMDQDQPGSFTTRSIGYEGNHDLGTTYTVVACDNDECEQGE